MFSIMGIFYGDQYFPSYIKTWIELGPTWEILFEIESKIVFSPKFALNCNSY